MVAPNDESPKKITIVYRNAGNHELKRRHTKGMNNQLCFVMQCCSTIKKTTMQTTGTLRCVW
jgi:hypothetical protein